MNGKYRSMWFVKYFIPCRLGFTFENFFFEIFLLCKIIIKLMQRLEKKSECPLQWAACWVLSLKRYYPRSVMTESYSTIFREFRMYDVRCPLSFRPRPYQRRRIYTYAKFVLSERRLYLYIRNHCTVGMVDMLECNIRNNCTVLAVWAMYCIIYHLLLYVYIFCCMCMLIFARNNCIYITYNFLCVFSYLRLCPYTIIVPSEW